MPFIRGRYYMNPVLGEAMEAARDAEAALHARGNRGQRNSDGANNGGDSENNSGQSSDTDDASNSGDNAPIHRVEIEASEIVPSHSGRAVRGFVARVHRVSDSASANDSAAQNSASGFPSRGASNGTRSATAETHVFADHRDLVSFLRDTLAKDAGK